ncbi:sulfatase family protein [Maribacter aestuarii]|uniref:sulfatase family protein n=1 Tax=Maribacter aestuarii TaxID=1130723 RepID=UPI0025A6489A|nr:sulfatase [Maribacter aestuarii]
MKLPTASNRKFISLLFLIVLAIVLSANIKSKPIGISETYVKPNILFLIADDWSYPNAGVYGDSTVRTPTFDRLANEGALFENAYCSAPSCSPSRASILLGRYPHQNESAGNLWSVIPKKFPNWVSLLETSGYHTGMSRKGWGPGNFKAGGYEHNPAGNEYIDFETFLSDRKDDQPFVYWFGSQDPHRTYETNAGIQTGMEAASINVPGFLPDTPCVRNDIMDYYFEVERFDRESGNIIDVLEQHGLLDNTLIVMTSDNGMPFPRAKANLYDYGTRMPLAIYWKNHIDGGIRISDFMNFIDFGPTFLEAAKIEIPEEFSGHSLMELFGDKKSTNIYRSKVFLERERHANVRKGDLSYPARAVRTKDFLYIKNFEPDRWPAGDPEVHISVGQYGDVDNSISKFTIMMMEGKPSDKDYFALAFSKRPAEELYVLANDPYNLKNVADNPKYKDVLATLQNELQNWMARTEDLRATEPKTDYWDKVVYTPDYQFQNYDLQKEFNDYKILIREGGGFKETNCE